MIFALCLLLAGAVHIDAFQLSFLSMSPSEPKNATDIGCLVSGCGLSLIKCGLNKDCRTCMDCMKKCALDDAICSSTCCFQYSTPLFNQMVDCGVAHNCLPPLTWSNNTCPDWSTRTKRVKNFEVARFAEVGQMFVSRGSHPVYDCFPCQKLDFVALPDGNVKTTWSVFLDPVVRDATYILKQETPNSLVTKYQLFGMPVEEHYYIMDYTEDFSFVLYVYCGFGFKGEYQGSVIYSKEKGAQPSPEVEARFAKVLKDNDLDAYIPPLDQYCKPDYSAKCANI